jgi:hypothetical protein
MISIFEAKAPFASKVDRYGIYEGLSDAITRKSGPKQPGWGQSGNSAIQSRAIFYRNLTWPGRLAPKVGDIELKRGSPLVLSRLFAL